MVKERGRRFLSIQDAPESVLRATKHLHEASIIMVAVRIGAVASWLGYSFMQRQGLNRGDFLAMQLLAETRQPDGDMASMIPKLSQLPTITELPNSVQVLGGDFEGSNTSDDCPIYQCGESLYCRPSRNQTSY